MLSDNNIRRINSKIADKLRDLDSIFTTPEKAEEIRKDLIVLNDLLNANKGEEKIETTPDSIVDELCELFRNRRR